MSIQMGGANELDTAYSDFEIQHASMSVDNADGTNQDVEVVYDVEPVSGDLDNDEVAELVAVYRHMKHRVSTDGTAQTETGASEAEYGLAINTPNRDQFLLNKSGDNEGQISVVDSETDSGNDPIATGSEIDEAEQLDYYSTEVPADFNELADGTGGVGTGGVDNDRFIDFRELTGHGPFVDRTDSMNVFIENGHRNIEYGTRVQVSLTFIWDVATIEDSRAQLAPPQLQ